MSDVLNESERYEREHLTRRLAAIAEDMRAMASRVQRYINDLERVGEPGIATYGAVIGNVQHDVLWGLANLHTDSLTRDASAADLARATGGSA